METERVNGHGRPERPDEIGNEDDEVSRDPSRLPVTNLDAYKTWCQRVKDDWDNAEPQ